MKRLLVSVGLLGALALGGALGACDSKGSGTSFNIPESKDLERGGLYVVYNHGCTKGCDQVEKGDLIQSIDGKPTKTEADFKAANVIDGQPHKLELIGKDGAPKSVEIVASPKTDMPPLENVPPLWVADAAKLDLAPEWARRRMFGHASPSVMRAGVVTIGPYEMRTPLAIEAPKPRPGTTSTPVAFRASGTNSSAFRPTSITV